MSTFLYAISSTIIVSLVSFIGLLTLSINPDKLKRATIFLVSLSAGTLLGDALLHLMPEIIEENGDSLLVWFWLLGGIIIFFILEKVVFWRHCHIPTSHEHPHHLGIMNIIGDGLHNFIDGAIIAGSFLVSVPLGIATTIAVIAHEIPQEMADFGVLIHAGFDRLKALMLNFLTAIAAIFGAVVTLVIGSGIENFTAYIIPFTAGGFIYIATADLIPELHKETRIPKSLAQLLMIITGIAIMWGLKAWFE